MRVHKEDYATKPTSVKFTKGDLEKIEELVKKGFYFSRSDVIRDGVRRLYQEEIYIRKKKRER